MTRRQPELLARWHDASMAVVQTLTRTWSVNSRRSLFDGDDSFRWGYVPTPHGYVVVWAWTDKTEYTIILDGAVYRRVDQEGASREALPLRAGLFAKDAAERDRAWRAAGGYP